MSGFSVLAYSAARGVRVYLHGDDLALEGPQAARDEVRDMIRSAKPDVVRLLRDPRLAGAAELLRTAEVTLNTNPSHDVCEDCGGSDMITLLTDYGTRTCPRCLMGDVCKDCGKEATTTFLSASGKRICGRCFQLRQRRRRQRRLDNIAAIAQWTFAATNER
ncbi:MAG: hypothetical protein ACLP66_03750 [Polyangia bacterium]